MVSTNPKCKSLPGFYNQRPKYSFAMNACRAGTVSWWAYSSHKRYEQDLVGQRPKCSTENISGKCKAFRHSCMHSEVEDMCRVAMLERQQATSQAYLHDRMLAMQGLAHACKILTQQG